MKINNQCKKGYKEKETRKKMERKRKENKKRKGIRVVNLSELNLGLNIKIRPTQNNCHRPMRRV